MGGSGLGSLMWFQVRWWLELGKCGVGVAGGWMGISLSAYSFKASRCGLIWTPKARCITFYDLASEGMQYHFYHIHWLQTSQSPPTQIEEVRN